MGHFTEIIPCMPLRSLITHDSQPGQSLESFIEPWFKPIAYGVILLSDYGYPCVYYPDYYGYQNIEYEGHRDCLECLMYARKEYAYGEMKKYLDDSRCIGFTRAGTPEHPCGVCGGDL